MNVTFKEEIANQQQQQQQQQQQMQQNQQQQQQSKLSRPKTVNIMPLNQVNTADFSNQSEMLATLDQNLKNGFDEDFYYEPFRISPTTINNQQWPFEIDFEKSFKPNTTANATQNQNPKNSRQQSSKNKVSNGATKCYTCKKLPVIKTASSIDKSSDATNEQYTRIYTLQNHQHLGREMYSSYGNAGLTGTSSLMTSTYNSMRRCISAKMTQISDEPNRMDYETAKASLSNADETRLG